MRKRLTGLCLVTVLVAATTVAAADRELAQQAHKALRSATAYLTEEVAYEGGYVGSYLADLSQGFGKLSSRRGRTWNWIQPPGTPAMGMAYVHAWRATKDRAFLDAAVLTARALVRGQLQSGGWDDNVDHSPEGERTYFYRRNEGSEEPALTSGINRSTLDDNITQHAMRLLVAVDQELEMLEQRDEQIHEAIMVSLEFLLTAQYENGAWPRDYPLRGRGYGDFYMYNDGVHRDCTDVLMIAHRAYGDPRYFDAVVRAGEFMLLSQLPEPHPIWAQQYDMDMQPGWARRFEPPAACAGESVGILRLLPEVAIFTGDTRFLRPIPAALAWFERSQLEDGRWARYYEIKTNRPLFQVSRKRTAYWLSYEDHDTPDHYAFKGTWGRGLQRVGEIAEQILALGPREYERRRQPQAPSEQERLARARDMQADVRQVIEAQDAQGRWVDTVRGQQMIQMRTFQQNMRTLSDYLRLMYGN